MRGAPARAVAAAGLLALGAPALAQERPWYVPGHAKLQLAGNVGFLSPGVGWTFARRFDADLFFGWVPEAVGGTDIFAVTAKLTWAPWVVDAGRWRLHPVTAALQVTYTFGDQYFVVPRFAFTPTALRGGVGIGVAASRPAWGRRVGLYAELGAIDIGLGYWLTNRDSVRASDVFSLALGARVEL